MKTSEKIFIAVIIVLIGIISYGLFQDYQIFQEEKLDISFQQGYQQGLLYTQQTGNVVIVSNQTGKLVVDEYFVYNPNTGQLCGEVN